MSKQVKIWSPSISEKQAEIVNCNKRYILIDGPRMSGKCLSGNLLAQTSSGLIRMSSAGGVPDEFVDFKTNIRTFDGKSCGSYAATSSVWRDKSREAITIQLSNGHRVTGSPRHPIWCWVGSGPRWMSLSEIKSAIESGVQISTPTVHGGGEWPTENVVLNTGHKTRKNTKFTTEITEDAAYFLGLIVGDGCCGACLRQSGTIGFTSADPELVEFVYRMVSDFWGGTINFSGPYDYRIQSMRLASVIRTFGMDVLAHEKRIPDFILRSPKRVLCAFISGLFDTDGGCEKGGKSATYCSASPVLADDVAQVLMYLGIPIRVWRRENDFKGATVVSVQTTKEKFESLIGFRLTRKRNAYIGSKCDFIRGGEVPPEAAAWIAEQYKNRASRNVSAKFAKYHNNRFVEKYVAGSVKMYMDAFKRTAEILECDTTDFFKSVYMDGNVRWHRIVKAFDSEADLFDFEVPLTNSFVAASVINHNTVGVLHRIAKHMWDVKGARVGMFAKTVKSASIAGTYKKLAEEIIPEWIRGGFGMKFTTEPKTDAATRTHHFRVSNAYGTESECYLFSCEHEQEVEAKVKNVEFSLVYFIELDNFKDRIVFDSTVAQLRMMPRIPYEQHQWIGDTNPPEDGEDSWIFKLWLDKDNPDNYANAEMSKEEIDSFKNDLHRIQVLPEHNTFLDKRAFAALKGSYGHSKNLMDRYIHGKWVADSSTSLFGDVFDESVHMIGNTHGSRENWELMVPSEHCTELLTGWDPGDSWHSFHVVEKVPTASMPVYCVLDELYNDERKVSLKMLTEGAMAKISSYEEYVARKHRRVISWRHWADAAAINNYKAAADAFDANVVFRESGGKIRLIAAPKGAGAVRRRVNILKMLLAQRRLFISANCFMTKEMIRKLKKGTDAQYVVRNKYKHIFDSLSYILDAEEPIEQASDVIPRTSSNIVVV